MAQEHSEPLARRRDHVAWHCVIAQAGMHVPCSSFRFRPYTAIYTRILGNDNLFKGLSTFNVEMAELRVILKGADGNSLVLGDEVCSGTEMGSATAIFATALEALHKAGSTFLFATHMHQVPAYPEVKALDGLVVRHLQVHYDATLGALVYDRKLKDGPGEGRYGLEVCKSTGLPEDFLRRAHALRRRAHGLRLQSLPVKVFEPRMTNNFIGSAGAEAL